MDQPRGHPLPDDAANPLLASVFQDTDPTGHPFYPHFSRRMLVYPGVPYFHRKEMLELAWAARIAGDSSFYLTFLEYVEGEPRHWEIPFRNLDLYDHLSLPQQSALYSPRSSWGIIFSEDGHGVIGSPEGGLVDALHDQGWDQHQQAREFVLEWKGRGTTEEFPEWVKSLLAHVYGEDEASALLAERSL